VPKYSRSYIFDARPALKAALEKVATTISKPGRAVLFQQGQAVSGVFLLKTGKAKLVLESEQSRARIVGPGALLGLPSAISQTPHSATVEILENAKVAYIGRKDLMRLLRQDTGSCLGILEILGRGVQEVRREKADCMLPLRRRGGSRQKRQRESGRPPAAAMRA